MSADELESSGELERSLSNGVENPPARDGNDNAVDDSAEADGDFVMLQKNKTHRKRAGKGRAKTRIRKVINCPYVPNVGSLTISDLQSAIVLENTAFHDPEHRATPEKLQYRLETCPELSLGVFCTIPGSQAKGGDVETLATARCVEANRSDGAVSVLLAHIVSTMCSGEVITDKDMDYPKGGEQDLMDGSADVGHQPSGRTVALHSLAVLPRLQGCGIGAMIVKAYLQRINGSGIADRVSLICQEHLVSYYERLRFEHRGPSSAQFGGGGWHDMVFVLPGPSKKLLL